MATVIGHSNQIDLATLSGGTWNAAYPLASLKTRYLAQKARTSNALAASSVIDLDLLSAQAIGVVALVAHNLTSAATVRIQGSSAASQTPVLYDSTAQTIYTGGPDYAKSFTPVSARYWRISIVDTANPAGYIALGRVFIGPAFAPAAGLAWGPGLAVESKTNVAEALGGMEFFDTRPNRRVWTGELAWLSDAEAWALWHPIQRAMDVYNEVYLIEDTADTAYRAQRNFLGRLRQLSPIQWPYVNQHACGVEIAELL